MKFVEGSEKCPDKTAKLDAPEDNRDTGKQHDTGSVLLFSEENKRTVDHSALARRCLYPSASQCPAQYLCVCSSQLLELPLPVGFAAEPLCLGFPNII